MRSIFFLISIFGLAFQAEASPQKADFSSLKEISLSVVESFPFDESCQFTAKENSFGLELSIAENNEPSVKIIVTDLDRIFLNAKNEAEGSYRHRYNVAGVGTLTIIHIDDAYNSVELSDGKNSARCVVEF